MIYFLVCWHMNAVYLTNIINSALQIIYDWGRSKKLTFGPEKTQLIAFTRKSRTSTFSMNGISIAPVSELKLLGIIIDQDMKFTNHVVYAMNKAIKLFKIFTRIARPTWGLGPEILRIIYLQAVEPTLTYGCHLWSSALRFKFIIKQLEQFQRPFAIRIAKGFRTLSSTSALAIANIIPIDLRIKEISTIEETKHTKLLAVITS